MASNNKLIISIFVIPVLIFVGILFFNNNKASIAPPNALHQNQGQTQDKSQANSSDNYNFTANEVPAFNFPSVAYASDLQKNVSIYNSKGEKMNADITASANGNGSSVQLNKTQAFTPGKYKLVVDQNGKKIEQDFTWGVLAINPNKSIYNQGEVAKLSIAVLDEKGAMVCDAKVTLDIKDPLGQTTTLSAQNGTIIVNPECTQKKYTVNPDYETKYQVKSLGTYQMSLTAVTKNGTYNIVDFFAVEENAEFDVERTIATRIFPYSVYPVSIKIIARKDFTGQIKESVPLSLSVSPLNGKVAYTGVQKADNLQYVFWNVSLKKGETINIGYTFKAPLISPQFYLLGPLSLGSNNELVFEEKRSWQLAIDAIEYSQTILNTSGLVAYWRLGESSGTFVDSAVGNDGTATGTPTRDVVNSILIGADDGAVSFPTVNDFITAPDSADLDLGDGPFSIEFWAQRVTDTGAFEIALNKGVNGYSVGVGGFDPESDNLTLGKRGVAVLAYSTPTIPADSSWHHYVITRSGAGAGNTLIYMDGVEGHTDTASIGTAPENTTSVLEIGREGAGSRWTGGLDELAIYNTVLSAATVRSHYEAGIANSAGVPTQTQSVSGKSGTTVTSRSLTITAPAAGSLIVTALSVDKDSGAITVPTGFTLINSYTSANVSGAFAYKISNGTETSVVWNWTTARTAASGAGVWTGTIGFDVATEADSGVSVVTSQSTGTTATTAQANELAITVVTADTGGNVDTGRAWTNSFTELIWESDTSVSGIPGLGMADKTLAATGTVETTYSTTGIGDQMWASIATFKAGSGGNFRFEGLQMNGLRIN